MKRISVGVLVLMILMMAGCNGGQGDTMSIDVAGSTSVQPLSEELAEAYYEKTGVVVNVAGGGSSAGVKAAADGAADIGAASRELKSSEVDLVMNTVIAYDGIAVIVHPDNNIANLTLDQIKDIYSGKIDNWVVLGGEDAFINVVSREDGSGTRGAFDDIVLGDEELSENAGIQNSTGAVIVQVANDPLAIGYASLGSVEYSEEVVMLEVNGVEPLLETIQNNSYKLVRPFNYLTKGEPAGAAKDFIDFILSPEGQEVVAIEFVPVN